MSTNGQARRLDREKLVAAAGKAIDRRAARTRASLFEALIGLTQQKGYDAIGVSEIADAANVGRSTFYLHFTDKDDLLRSGAGQLSDLLSLHIGASDEPAGPFAFSRFMFEHTRSHMPLYRALMSSRAGAIILEKFRGILGTQIRRDLAAFAGPDRNQALTDEVTVQLLLGAFMSLLTWWLDRDAKEPAAQMDTAFRALAASVCGTAPPAA